VQGLPAIAVSLDNVRAKSIVDYAESARYTVAFVKVRMRCGTLGRKQKRVGDMLLELLLHSFKTCCVQAVLGLIPGSENCLQELTGSVININVPAGTPHGFHMAHQGSTCVYPAFKESFVQSGPPDEEGRRRFRNTSGDMRW
jgi:broad specificity polyphosphatase/5'/3'-nucleotidase SurE